MGALKIKDLLESQKCGRKAFFRSSKIVGEISKAYLITKAFKNVFFNIDLKKMNDSLIRKIVEDTLPDEYFVSKFEKNAEIELLVAQIKRYLAYEQTKDRTIVRKNVTEDIEFEGQLIRVSADFLFENKKEQTIEVIKFSRKAPSLTYRGRKEESKPECSLELYMLQKLGEKLFPGKKVIAGLYHLKSKKDNTTNFAEIFDAKQGENVITYSFEDEQRFKDYFTNLLTKLNISKDNISCDKSLCTDCEYVNVCKYKHIVRAKSFGKAEVSKGGKLKLAVPQKFFVNFKEGFCRTNAGAGAGKTTLLSLRVCKLLKGRGKSKDLLLITYTDKGRKEMLEKIEFWMEEEGIDCEPKDLNILTFNSWGYEIIKKEYKKLGFKEAPKLLDTVDAYDIIIELLDSTEKIKGLNYNHPLLDFPNAKGAIVQLFNIFSDIKSFNIKTAFDMEIILGFEEEFSIEVLKVFKRFQEELVNRNYIQYQDQLNMVLELLKKDEKIAKKYSYKHIMVDEFQDSDSTQMQILKILTEAKSFKSLVVVGDDSQSIFRFRNVQMENILNFDKMFKDVEDITLYENYRSTPEIIDLANKLIKINKNRLNKKLVAHKSNGKKPTVLGFNTQQEEYQFIADDIKKKISQGERLEDIAVIGRNKAELKEIENILNASNIPSVIVVPEVLVDNKDVQKIINFSKFFTDFSLKANLMDYLQLVDDNFLEKTESELIEEIDKTRINLEEKFNSLNEKEQVELFYELIKPVMDRDALVEAFIEDVKSKDLENIHDLVKHITKLTLYNSKKTIEIASQACEAVSLTTAHSSKGREYKVVYNSINKYKYSNITQDELEEERRLLYVSITRAKEELILTYNENRDSTKNIGYVTGFVNELKGILENK